MRRSGYLLAVVAGLLLAMPGAAADVAPAGPATGWWWRVQSSAYPTPLPPPPDVGAGQLLVEGTATGATAVAAVRYEMPRNEVANRLTLAVVSESDAPAGGAAVVACRTSSRWTPAAAAPWENKPLVDAKACASGVRSPDGSAWTFELAPLSSAGVVDLALVAGVDPTLASPLDGSTVRIVFAAPDAASLTTTPPAGSSTTSVTGPFSSPASVPVESPASRVTEVDVAAPVAPNPVVASALPPSALRSSRAGGAGALGRPRARRGGARWPGALVLGLALLGLPLAWRSGRLAALTREDGLGRFVSERSGPPPSLR